MLLPRPVSCGVYRPTLAPWLRVCHGPCGLLFRWPWREQWKQSLPQAPCPVTWSLNPNGRLSSLDLVNRRSALGTRLSTQAPQATGVHGRSGNWHGYLDLDELTGPVAPVCTLSS